MIEATRPRRPFSVPALLDFDASVNSAGKRSLMAQSRASYSNDPLVRSVIQQRALFATKNAWRYQPISDDTAWKTDATAYFDKFARVACVNGLDLSAFIYHVFITLDRDGDFFALLTESENGFAQLQHIPAHRVATRKDIERIPKGKFAGYKVISGVIVNGWGRPVAYSILGDTEAGDKIVEAPNVIHIFDPESAESVRGIPLVSHALTDLAKLEASKKAELTSMQLHSTISLIEKLGEKDGQDNFLGNGGANVPLYEEFQKDGGTIAVYRSEGSDLKSLESNRPSPEYQSFRQKLREEIVVSLGWSTSLLDGSNKTSVENRLNIRVAEMTVADRIALLTPHLKRIVIWVLAKAIKRGELAPSPDLFNLTFSRPPFISADISRIESSTRENLKLGITTLTQICDEGGRTVEDHLAEKYADWAKENEIRARYNLPPLAPPHEAI